MKTIHFVRHGRTGGNEIGVWQTFDQTLSDHGREQAQKVAKRFKNSKIDHIIASDMDRAFETAQIINSDLAHLNLDIVPTKLLHEIYRPKEVRGQLKTDEKSIEIMKEVRAHWNDPSWKFSDEENFFDLKARVEKALDEVLALPGENIIAVTHEFVLRMIFGFITYKEVLTPELYEAFINLMWHENTGVTTFTYDNGKWRMLNWNDHSHLLA